MHGGFDKNIHRIRLSEKTGCGFGSLIILNFCIKYQEPVEVIIPEQLAASYGLYIWPSAPVLAWYIWLNQVTKPVLAWYI